MDNLELLNDFISQINEEELEDDTFVDVDDFIYHLEEKASVSPMQVTPEMSIQFVYYGALAGDNAEVCDGCPITQVITVNGELFMREGTYSSWDSTEWEDFTRCVEKTKTVTFYESV